jgi:hypothetical protein
MSLRLNPSSHSGTSQRNRILWLLCSAYPSWTPSTTLANISLQYNARILELRGAGWQIENRVEVVNGVRRGSFRLARPLDRPNPSKATETAPDSAPPSDRLFPDDAPLRHMDLG